MSRYTLAQIRAVMAGDMATFFAEPHPASTATASARSRPAAKAPAPTATPSPIAKPSDFMALVQAKMQSGLPNAAAVRAVAIEHPDLHTEYLRTFNAQARQVETLDRRRARLERDLRESRSSRSRSR